MKQLIAELLGTVIENLKAEGRMDETFAPSINVENARDKTHGDFATNLAMMLAKPMGQPPRQVAQMILDRLPNHEQVEKVEIAGPGFINFFINDTAKFDVLANVFAQGAEYGRCNVGQGRSVLVEFVSANPTGPLHVGHGRGAAYGATLSNLLDVAGFQVSREYYVNDAGRQMDILATSTWLRYLEIAGENVSFPSNGYQGAYVKEIAEQLWETEGTRFVKSAAEVFENVCEDEQKNADGEVISGDKEAHIDDLIAKAKTLLGEADYRVVFDQALNDILSDIRDDLKAFGVSFDQWFSERSLMDSGVIDAALEKLQAAGQIYEKNGALWFRSTEYGDEKDRVVVRDNGMKTYFASDIAYHFNKLERGYETLIDIWGSDHHGYVPRVKAAMEAMDTNPDALKVLLVQFAVLYRGGEKVPMSTRSGQFVTLRELRDEVGADAARFFYVQRKSEQHMDFDLDLATSQSNENPVYYIQYAHARICRVFEQSSERGFEDMAWANSLTAENLPGLVDFALLSTEYESDLATLLAQYPEVVARAAQAYEPHQIAYYLKDLAHALHSYYNSCMFVVDEKEVRQARLALVAAVRQVLHNGLTLLGVSAPDRM